MELLDGLVLTFGPSGFLLLLAEALYYPWGLGDAYGFRKDAQGLDEEDEEGGLGRW